MHDKHYNPQDALELFDSASWQKASYSSGNGTGCVELARSSDGGSFGIRDSKNPGAAALLFDQGEIAGFIDGAKKGEFDHLLG